MFYTKLQSFIDKVDKKDILIVHDDMNAKMVADTLDDWKDYYSPTKPGACKHTWCAQSILKMDLACTNGK